MSYAKYNTLGINQKLIPQNYIDNVIDIKSSEQKNNLISSSKLLCIDLYADWCGPCKMIEDKFYEMSSKYNCVFAKENYDLNLSQNISGVPTFFIYKDGKLQTTVVGADINQVESIIIDNLKNDVKVNNLNLHHFEERYTSNSQYHKFNNYDNVQKMVNTNNRRMTPQSVQFINK